MKTKTTIEFDFLEVMEIYYAIKDYTEKEACNDTLTSNYRMMKLKILIPLHDKLKKELDKLTKE